MGGGLHLLLHQEVVDLLDVLVQEIGLLDQSLEFNDTVEQASSNLTGHISMGVMDGEVDGVTDELQLLSAIGESMELGKVALREAQLPHFDGSLSLGHGHSYLLLGVEFVVWLTGREAVVVHDGGTMVSGHLVALDSGLVGSVTTLVASSLLVSATSLVSSLTATTLLLVLAAVLVVVVVLLAGLVSHVAALTAGVVTVHLITAFGLIANFFSMSDPVHHLVLFLLLTLVLKLLLADPEIDGDGSVSERRRLVEVLDGKLGMVHVLVQDESLFVGRLRVVGVDAELD